MQPPSRPSAESRCEHIRLQQTILSPLLPPLYIANPAPPAPAYFSKTTALTIFGSLNPPISLFLVSQLERVHACLGPKKVRSPFLARDIEKLQRELEGGMARSRRQQVEIYVLGIKDPWKKAATELYLTRYPGFVMRGDGRLDYGTRPREQVGTRGLVKGWELRSIGGCGVM